uniref:UPAR/Ly6 domain-containing protein n=1 Tax=Mesocestoides corti TaxID=53468 RepID=A0A5K3FHG7_MESCO
MPMVVLILFLFLLSFPKCLSIYCYKCVNCLPNPETWKKEKNCAVCMTETMYKSNEISTIHRRCQKRCKPLEAVIAGEGSKVTCCSTNLCNSARPKYKRLTSLYLIAMTIAASFMHAYP